MTALDALTRALATGLAEAVAKDEAEAKDETIPDRGFDLSAGMFGVHVSAWLRGGAAALEGREVLEDVVSHYGAFSDALNRMYKQARGDDIGYWHHEGAALARMHLQATAILEALPKKGTT